MSSYWRQGVSLTNCLERKGKHNGKSDLGMREREVDMRKQGSEREENSKYFTQIVPNSTYCSMSIMGKYRLISFCPLLIPRYTYSCQHGQQSSSTGLDIGHWHWHRKDFNVIIHANLRSFSFLFPRDLAFYCSILDRQLYSYNLQFCDSLSLRHSSLSFSFTPLPFALMLQIVQLCSHQCI